MSDWRIPGFEELRGLGVGAQGRVVLARRVATGELVAIKYLAPELLTDPAHMALFRDEVNMLSRVANPHVTRLHEYVETPRGAAIIMEAVNGVSLRAVLSDSAPLPPEAALTVLKGSLLGLAAAHSAAVVHRDYKPANVIVQDNGNSKLIDFGIAVLAGEASRSGTPAYMAPEQWHGAPASPATDVYAATCVFFECVTGERPYHSGDITRLRQLHMAAPIPVNVVPEQLRPLVMHGMAKNPAQRPPGAGQFVAELEQVAIRAYGPDWERRGWMALGAATALLAAAFPMAMLGAAMPGTTTALGHAATHVAQKTGLKGLLTKFGGAKTGTGLAAGAAIATAIWLLWPPQQSVGGTSSGSLRMYLAQPGVIMRYRSPTVADSPVIDFRFTVTPARIRPGMTVHVTDQYSDRLPGPPARRADAPSCYDAYAARQTGDFDFDIRTGADEEDSSGGWLFRSPPADPHQLPRTPTVRVPSNAKAGTASDHYDVAECAEIRTQPLTVQVTIPRAVHPGRYLLSPLGPPRIVNISVGPSGKAVPVSLGSAGARAEGTLALITILPR